MSKPPDHTHRAYRRGPIVHVDSGRGAYPWLWELRPDPGWVYRYERHDTGATVRCCYRCLPDVTKLDQATGRILWDDAPPAPGARCPRCERPYGERPVPETEPQRSV